MHIKRALAVLAISVASFSAQAASLYSSNGHYYELFTFTDVWRLDWNGAKAYAETSLFNGSHGHLATISNQGEDDFVWGLGAQSFYLGASDNSKLILDQNTNTLKWKHQSWQWVTGEAFSYQNFFFGEPNHWNDNQYDNSGRTPDNEDYLMYWSRESQDNQGRWNDTNLDSSYVDAIDGPIKYTTRGFVVEYEPGTAPAAIAPATVPVPPTLWLVAAGLVLLARGKKGSAMPA